MLDLYTYITEAEDRKETKEFIMIKPGFLDLTQTILNFLRKKGVYVTKWCTKTLTKAEAEKFYEPHKDEDFYKDLVKYMTSGPSTGFAAINTGSESMDDIKDEVRKKWGKTDMKNVMHSSDSNARRRIEQGIYLNTTKITSKVNDAAKYSEDDSKVKTPLRQYGVEVPNRSK